MTTELHRQAMPEARGDCSGGRVALAALLRRAGVGSLSFFEVGRPLAQV